MTDIPIQESNPERHKDVEAETALATKDVSKAEPASRTETGLAAKTVSDSENSSKVQQAEDQTEQSSEVVFDYEEGNRRQYQRVFVTIYGRFMRENKEEFPCYVTNISIGGAAINTNGKSEAGEEVILYLDDIGRISGKVVRTFDQGFAMTFDINNTRRNKLADRLTWLVNKDTLVGTANRSFERYEPKNNSITIIFPDQTQTEGHLRDISLSGASLLMTARPAMGTELIVGKLRAKVIRHHADGVGVQFLDIQKPTAFSSYFK